LFVFIENCISIYCVVYKHLVSDYYVSRVNIGVFCHTPGIAVARSIPRKAALLMLFTGQPITAQGMFSFNCNYSVD